MAGGDHRLWHRIVSGEARGPGPASARGLLAVASVAYGGVVGLRNLWYTAGFGVRRAAVPVVSVGNLTVGGTGKTPTVELLCRRLAAMGRRPAILTRGYGRAATGGASDEADLLAAALPDVPVIVNPDRVAGAAAAVTGHGADVAVLDDGMQHRRLGRDLDVALVDAADPDGGGWVLPRGRLREPLRGLARADVVMVRLPAGAGSAEDLAEESRVRLGRVLSFARNDAVRVTVRLDATGAVLREGPGDGRSVPAAELAAGMRIGGAFCGLGRPAAFAETLAGLGVRTPMTAFADHHAFTSAELAELREGAGPGAVLLTTGKDWMRLRRMRAEDLRPLWPLGVVQAGMRVLAGGAELDAALRRAVGTDI